MILEILEKGEYCYIKDALITFTNLCFFDNHKYCKFMIENFDKIIVLMQNMMKKINFFDEESQQCAKIVKGILEQYGNISNFNFNFNPGVSQMCQIEMSNNNHGLFN